MAVFSGANIVNDGLVFHYDMDNTQKSWKGAPATNLFTETNLNNWSKSATVFTSSFRTPFNQPAYSITDNSTTTWQNVSRNTTVPNNTSSYTVSLFVRKTTGGTSARLGFNAGFNTGGTTVATNPRFNSDTGAGTGNSISFGDWWYWYFTLSNNGTGNTNFYSQFYPATGLHNSSDNVIAVGTAIIGEPMLVSGSTPFRFISGTRSNTEAILDLTGNNTFTANNLTYNNNNTFQFSSGNITIPFSNDFDFSKEQTIVMWMKPGTGSNSARRNPYNQAYGGSGTITHETSQAFTYFFGTHGGNSTPYQGRNSSFTVGPNELAFIAVTRNQDTNTVRWYKNGNLISTQNAGGYAATNNGSSPILIGTGYTTNFIGEISKVLVYKKELTPIEINQIFEATRSRYGI
jgi:hypothetical protein